MVVYSFGLFKFVAWVCGKGGGKLKLDFSLCGDFWCVLIILVILGLILGY